MFCFFGGIFEWLAYVVQYAFPLYNIALLILFFFCWKDKIKKYEEEFPYRSSGDLTTRRCDCKEFNGRNSENLAVLNNCAGTMNDSNDLLSCSNLDSTIRNQNYIVKDAVTHLLEEAISDGLCTGL